MMLQPMAGQMAAAMAVRGSGAAAAAAASGVGVSLALAWCLRPRAAVRPPATGASAVDRGDDDDHGAAAATRSRSRVLLQDLCAGGAAAAAVLGPALERATVALEIQSPTASRAARRANRRLLDRLEGFEPEALDAARCDRIARVRRAELEAVCARISAVDRAAAATADAPEGVAVAVSELLDSLERCDGAALQAASLLRAGGSPETSADALGLLCSLPRDSLAGPSLDERAALGAVIGLAAPPRCAAERASAWVALYALAVRNGLDVAASRELCDCTREGWVPLLQEASRCAADDGPRMRDTMRVAAAHRAAQLATCQGMVAAPADVRAPLEAALMRSLKPAVAEFACYTNATVREAVRAIAEMLRDERGDTAVAIGAGAACQDLIMFRSPVAAEAALELRVFEAGLRLFQRICPSLPEPTWWVQRIHTVDVKCVELWGLWMLLGATHILDTTVPPDTWMAGSDWWQPVLELAVQMVHTNESAATLFDDVDSDGRGSRSVHFGAVCYATRTIEAASREESQQPFLLASGVQSALLYSFVHDLSFLGLSLKSSATGALVSLQGIHDDEDEGGVLNVAVTEHVVETFCNYFDDRKHSQHTLTVSNMLAHARQLQSCLISDVSKVIVLRHPGVVDALVRGLLLDAQDPRASQTGANALRDICAGALLQLSMLDQGAEMLRGHDGVVRNLANLCCCEVANLRVCAEQTLHRIDPAPTCNDGSLSTATGLDIDSSSSRAGSDTRQHVMLSHSMTDQPVVDRISAALRSRGYRVSIDVDMERSNVGTMRSTVQNAAIALICVSRSYGESPICRAEAMYIQQAGLPILPLLLQQSRRSAGWMRKMLGQKVQYTFLDETLHSANAFNSRIDEVARALGGLGRSSTAIDDVSVILPAQHAEEKSAEAVTERLLQGQAQRQLVLTQALEHATFLLARSSRDQTSVLSRKSRAKLRARSTALLNDDVNDSGRAIDALCAGHWSQQVGESTGALLSDVFQLDDLRSQRHVDRMEFLLVFLEKLSAIMRGRLPTLVGLVRTGGKSCAQALLGALDHGMQVLDSMGTDSARDSTHRSSLLSLSTRISFSADVLDKFDAEFCDTLAAACNSGNADAKAVAQLILSVEQLSIAGEPAESVKTVSALVDGIEKLVAAEKDRIREAEATEQQQQQVAGGAANNSRTKWEGVYWAQAGRRQVMIDASPPNTAGGSNNSRGGDDDVDGGGSNGSGSKSKSRQLEESLRQMSSRALRQRAELVGIDEDALQKAYKSKEPKRATIALIVSATDHLERLAARKSPAPRDDTPDLAAPPPPPAAAAAAAAAAPAPADATAREARSEGLPLLDDDSSEEASPRVSAAADAQQGRTVNVSVVSRPRARQHSTRSETDRESRRFSTKQLRPVAAATSSSSEPETPAPAPAAPQRSVDETHASSEESSGDGDAHSEDQGTAVPTSRGARGAAVRGGSSPARRRRRLSPSSSLSSPASSSASSASSSAAEAVAATPAAASARGEDSGAHSHSHSEVLLPVGGLASSSLDLQLAMQGSRLRKERMRLEARAASPASRGAV
jgi:hypothetical protein